MPQLRDTIVVCDSSSSGTCFASLATHPIIKIKLWTYAQDEQPYATIEDDRSWYTVFNTVILILRLVCFGIRPFKQ